MKEQKKKSNFNYKYIIIVLVLIIIVSSAVIIVRYNLFNKIYNNIKYGSLNNNDTLEDINKPLVVSKVINGNTKDEYKETNTIKFEKGFATTIESEMEFKDETAAEMMFVWQQNQKSVYDNVNIIIKLDGTKVLIKNTMKSYSNFYFNFRETVTRREIKNEFRLQEYTIVE
jgi:hypothetical protein